MGKYLIVLAPKAREGMKLVHKSGNKTIIRKIERFIEELSDHPYIGTGKPERLKGDVDIWSRRIDKKNRLLYKVEEEKVLVLVLSLLGHYDDK